MFLSLGKNRRQKLKVVGQFARDENESKVAHEVCIDKCMMFSNKVMFLSGWYWSQNGIRTIDVEFDDENRSNVEFFTGARKDVSALHKLADDFHNWGFAIVVDSISAKRPISIIVTFTDGHIARQEILTFGRNDFLDCMSAVAFYNQDQKKKIKDRFDQLGIRSALKSDCLGNVAPVSESGLNSYVENAFKLKSGILIYGWVDDSSDEISRINVVKNNVVLCESVRFSRRIRKDVNNVFSLSRKFKAGLLLYFSDDSVESTDNYSLELTLASGLKKWINLVVDESVVNVIELTQQILGIVDFMKDDLDGVLGNTLVPAVHDVWAHTSTPYQIETTEYCVKNRPNTFETSVVVPIYRRFDFINYQLAHFFQDKDFKNVELIYAIDDPSIYDDVATFCTELANVYEVYFKTVFFNANLGFGGANNAAAKIANGKYLLLLNSDVIPKQHGWLSSMLQTYKNQKKTGVLGVDLLFYDESIQHAGMKQEWSEKFRIWLNKHPGKGLPKSISGTSGVEPMSSVTGACMLIDKELFNKIGGFDSRYILGDFEDSDLCFKLIKLGYVNYINHDIEMYHLERQSQDLIETGDWKFKLTLLNGWQHSNNWAPVIQRINQV